MATNPHSLSESARLKWLATHTEGQRCRLGPYTFWVNPSELHRVAEALYVEVPTLDGGYVFNDFGIKPYQITITGDTGSMGAYDLDDKKGGLGANIPRFGVANKMTTFSVPGRGSWPCRVVRIDESASAADPFIWHYEIELRVYPDAKPSYVKVASLASMVNGITGPFGTQPAQTTVDGGGTRSQVAS